MREWGSWSPRLMAVTWPPPATTASMTYGAFSPDRAPPFLLRVFVSSWRSPARLPDRLRQVRDQVFLIFQPHRQPDEPWVHLQRRALGRAVGHGSRYLDE